MFHAALAVAAYFLPKEHRVESVAIELADIKKKNEKPKALPPPPPPPRPPPTEKPKPPPPPKEKAKIAAEAPKEAPAPEPLGADGFADLEAVSLGNGGGGGGGAGEGVAIAAAARATGPASAGAAAAPVKHKVQALSVAPAEECNEPEIRPKHLTQILPKMTHEAQVAEIEGVVRVEVTVDESGQVIAARVVSGLGYGLDEEALRAAKAWTFHPATRCGRRTIGHTIIPFRFSLT